MSREGGQEAEGGVGVAALLRNLVLSLAGLMILIGGSTAFTVRAEATRVDQLAHYIGPAFDANRVALQALTDAGTAKRRFLMVNEASDKANYVASVKEFERQLALTRSILASDGLLDKQNSSWPSLQQAERRSSRIWLTFSQVQIGNVGNGIEIDVDSQAAQTYFLSFRSDNEALDRFLRTKRDKLSADSNLAFPRQIVLIVGITLMSLLAAAWAGRRAIRTLTIPLDTLRSVVGRQRRGDTAARADEHVGAREVRMLAADFNALSADNQKLTHDQSRAIELHELARSIDRAMRDSGDTAQSLATLSKMLGEGLGVDRVIVQIVDGPSRAALQCQWAGAGLARATWAPLSGMERLREIINQLWSADKQLVVSNISDTEGFTDGEVRRFQEKTGLRSVLLVPIGLGDAAWGLMMVGDTDKVRDWNETETTTVQRSAYCISRLVSAATHDANQENYIKRLEILDRQKTAFLATVSHELRTPLTSITGYLEILEGGDAGGLSESQRKMLAIVGRNSARLQGLIEDLLVLNRIESGGRKVSSDPVDLAEIAAFAIEELRPLADQAGIAINLTTPDHTIKVDGDGEHLQRAFVNVLSNAIKFSPETTAVDLVLAVEDQFAVITCTDYGIGIPAADMDELFSRFFRASNAQEKSIPGTGLGLAIIRQILEDHGGTVDLESEESVSTTVTLRLPLG